MSSSVRPIRPIRYLRASLTGVAIACAGLAIAPGAARAEIPERPEILELDKSPVELVSPLPASVLLGGSTAELAWRPLADFTALAGAEEWEAFLSLDGGRTFAIRLTPHLDLALRRFVFRVPDLPSGSARLLLRFGDERQERAVVLQTELRIVRAPSATSGGADFFRQRSFTSGEPARSGDPGVVLWVEGHRDGSGTRTRNAAPGPAFAGTDPTVIAAETDLFASDESAGFHFGADIPLATHPAAADLLPGAAAAHAEPRLASDILLLIQRQNE